MRKLLAQLVQRRLQYILVLGFALTAGITIAVGALIINSLINNYLAEAEDRRVGRDMDLADAFYNNKLADITAMAGRLASVPAVRQDVNAASEGIPQAVQVVEEAIQNEIFNLPMGAQRFAVVTDAEGKSIAGRVATNGQFNYALPGTDWSDLPIVNSVLTQGRPQAGAEVVPAEILSWIGLDKQAHIELIDTPRAAPQPFDRREGTAGLTLISVDPIVSDEGQITGSVLVGHLFNNDFTLVDRIKEVAGVDTVTIFFGDLRVSTNVPLDESGRRAIGTRVSQEVYDQGLVKGEEFTGSAFVVNQNYITRYRPLTDYAGQVVGMLYVGAEQATFQRLLLSFHQRVYLIAAATILLAVVIAGPVAWSISRPLRDLAAATRKVAQGDWSVRAPISGYNEMRTLASSFNTMVETLRETQEQLIQKEKLASVGQLAAGVAHEINNPLGSVLLYADILRKETPDDNAQQRSDLEMIINEAQRCKVIVNDLLNFSRQNEVMAQETDLNAILDELVDEAGKQEIYSQVQLIPELEPDLPAIQADPLQLRQLFLNLMNNAAEAMPEGGRLTVRTRRGPSQGFVTAEVEDTGIGIPESNMKKLFTPFFTTKPIGKGTGLGLAIIYGIVKMHRGQIKVRSQPGKGTTFTVVLRERLPLQAEQAEGSFVLQ
jgi:two-component system NtrC family sensor kinase